MRIKDTGYSLYTYSNSKINGDTGTIKMAATTKSGKSAPAAPSLPKEWIQKKTTRIDKIELNCRSSHFDSFVDSLKESICEDLSKDAECSHLQELKDDVESGNYSLDSGALAKALLFYK